MSTYEDYWKQLDAPTVASVPLTPKESQYQFLNSNTDKLNLSPDEEYKMGWGPDAMSEDWINQKAKAIQKNINDSSSIAVLRKGMEQAATPSPVADAAQAAAKTGNGVDGVSQSGHSGTGAVSGNIFSNMTPAEQAKWYSENPTAGKFSKLAADLFGATSLGGLQKRFQPNFVRDQYAIFEGRDPTIKEGILDARDAMASRGESPQPNNSMSVADQYASYGQGRVPQSPASDDSNDNGSYST